MASTRPLHLLYSLLCLGNQVLFIIKLSCKLVVVLLLVCNDDLNVPLVPFKLNHTILGHLEVSLNLPLLLLNGCPRLLLLVKTTLQLSQRRLELGLDGVKVVHLLIDSNHVIIGFGLSFRDVLLFLVQLVDHLILLSNLILQYLDGVIAVSLLKLNLGNGQLNILNLLLDNTDGSTVSLDLSSEGDPGALLIGEFSLPLLQLSLGSSLEGGGLGLPVGVDRHITLLLSQLLAHGLNFTLKSIKASIQLSSDIKGGLVGTPASIGLLFESCQLCLRVGLAKSSPGLLDDHEPSPVPAGQVLPELPLGNLDQLPLVELLLVDSCSDPLEDLTLDETDPLDDQLVTLLLETTEGSRTEEDKSVSEPVPLAVEGDAIHEGSDGHLVVR